MNRSVINWMIAASVLTAGIGVGAVPAAADPGEPGVVSGPGSTDSPGGTDIKDGGTTDDGGTNDDGAHVPGRRPPRPERNSRPDDGQAWPCRWNSNWNCPRFRTRRNFNRWLPGPVVPPVPRTVPVAPAVEPELDVAALATQAVPQALPGAVAGTVAQAAPQTVPPAQVFAPASVVPRAPAPAVPAAPARSLPRPPVAPAIRAVPPQAPAAVPDPAEALRLGYPEELRNADFRQVASVALPGLAAIAGMTALGGMFGYRQAKAGYVLRTAGAGRFLQ